MTRQASINLHTPTYLAEFSSDIQHVSESTNIPADARSYLCALSSPAFCLERLVKLQEGDQELLVLRSSTTTLNLEDMGFTESNGTITGDTSTSIDRSMYADKFTIHSIRFHIPD